MSNKLKYCFFSVLNNVWNHKALRRKKIAAGIVFLAAACSSGGNDPAKSVGAISKKLILIDPLKKDSILIKDTTFVSPVDSSLIYPPDCYAKQAPVMCYDEAVQPSCYDMPAEPTCYDIVSPENE